jgi:hypothetical protein
MFLWFEFYLTQKPVLFLKTVFALQNYADNSTARQLTWKYILLLITGISAFE